MATTNAAMTYQAGTTGVTNYKIELMSGATAIQTQIVPVSSTPPFTGPASVPFSNVAAGTYTFRGTSLDPNGGSLNVVTSPPFTVPSGGTGQLIASIAGQLQGTITFA